MANNDDAPKIRSFDTTNDHRGIGHSPRIQRPTSPTALEDDEIELFSYNGDVEDGVIIRILSEDGDDDDIYKYDSENDDVIPPQRAAKAFRDGGAGRFGADAASSGKAIGSAALGRGHHSQTTNHQEDHSVSSEAILRDLDSANDNNNVLLWKNDNNVVTIVQGDHEDGDFDDDGTEQGVDIQYQERKPTPPSQPETSQGKHQCWAILDVIKYTYSLTLLLFSLFIIVALIFSEQTFASREGHPILAFVLTLFLLIWLAMIEGGQGCIVGLHPIDLKLYKHSHKLTWTSTSIAYKGNNLQRFIIGRQFLVVLVVFAINICNGLVVDSNKGGDNIFDSNNDSSSSIPFNEFIPSWLMSLFIKSNVAMILLTTVIGQLTSQINSAYCMLDFINGYLMIFTTYLSLAIEYSGILHAVYLVEMFFQWVTGSGNAAPKNYNKNQHQDSTDEESQHQIEELQRISRERNMPPTSSADEWKSNDEMALYIARIIFSLFVLALSFAVTVEALFLGKTAVSQDYIPPYISIIFFVCLMIFIGILEGLQIALFAVKNMPLEELQHHTIARINYEFVFSSNRADKPNTKLQSVLIGRQILVTLCMFIVARITTITVNVGTDANLFNVYDSVQVFFNTGLLGAVVTTILGSLIWRIIASSFPIAFLSNPIIYILLRLCLLLEASGVCSSAWVLASIYKSVFDLKEDEIHIGKREERRARNVVRHNNVGGVDNNGATGMNSTIIPQLMTVASASFDDDHESGGTHRRRNEAKVSASMPVSAVATAATTSPQQIETGTPTRRSKHAITTADSTPERSQQLAEKIEATRTASYRGFDIDKALKRVLDDEGSNDIVNVDVDVNADDATDNANNIERKDTTSSRYRNINNDLNQLLQEEFGRGGSNPPSPPSSLVSSPPMPQSPRNATDSKAKRKWMR